MKHYVEPPRYSTGSSGAWAAPKDYGGLTTSLASAMHIHEEGVRQREKASRKAESAAAQAEAQAAPAQIGGPSVAGFIPANREPNFTMQGSPYTPSPDVVYGSAPNGPVGYIADTHTRSSGAEPAGRTERMSSRWVDPSKLVFNSREDEHAFWNNFYGSGGF